MAYVSQSGGVPPGPHSTFSRQLPPVTCHDPCPTLPTLPSLHTLPSHPTLTLSHAVPSHPNLPSHLPSQPTLTPHPPGAHLWEPPVVVEHDYRCNECLACACWEAHQAVAADEAPGGLELILTQAAAVRVDPRPAWFGWAWTAAGSGGGDDGVAEFGRGRVGVGVPACKLLPSQTVQDVCQQ
jgi:hypothetical protein